MKHWHVIQQQPKLKQIFYQPPIVSYRKEKSQGYPSPRETSFNLATITKINGCLENDDLENDVLENDDLENDELDWNDDLENDNIENDDLENDDGDEVARRIKRLEEYRRREIRGR